jgi:hypothetical protein
MTEVLKINEGLYVDLKDFYNKVIVSRNIKSYSEDPNLEE